MTPDAPPNAAEKANETTPLAIAFDCCVLVAMRQDTPPPEFRLLQRLAAAGKVSLHVPEMAAREWISRRAAPAAAAIVALESGLKGLRRLHSLSRQEAAGAILGSEHLTGESLQRLRDGSFSWHAAEMHRLRIASIPLVAEDWRLVLDGYFEGAPPFGGEKSRSDLPDAMVLAGVRRLCGASPRMAFVCADTRLRRAAESLGIATAASLVNLLKLDSVAALHSDPEFALWWERNIRAAVAAIVPHDEELASFVVEHAAAMIGPHTISHYEIPEDNSQARIWGLMDVDNVAIDWNGAESLGEGVLSVPMTFESEIDLEFDVFRGEAFDVPDWVSVSYGDFELDHYFEASGVRQARYTARLVLEFAAAIKDRPVTLEEAEISIEDAEFEDFTD